MLLAAAKKQGVLDALVNAKNYAGATPMHVCAERGHARLAGALAKTKPALDTADITGRTPLQLACFWGHAHVAEALLKAGADPDARANATGESARELCEKSGGSALRDVLGA